MVFFLRNNKINKEIVPRRLFLMKTYLDQIPAPLLKDFANGRVVPIFGAGFSMNATVPKEKKMPNWKDLGKAASKVLPDFFFDDNPIDALSCYEETYSRNALLTFLHEQLLIGKIKPSETTKAICAVFSRVVCTTNFDNVIEDSYRASATPFATAASQEELPFLPNDKPFIIKFHGDFEHPLNMVITESDYDLFLEKNPIMVTFVSGLLITNTLLLVGYSFDDPDFRGLWASLTNRLGKISTPAYCFLVGASKQEIQKYQRRGIRVINLDGPKANYSTVLLRVFLEIGQYITKNSNAHARSLDDSVSGQLMLPSESNRLCYLSAGASNYGLIKDLLIGVLENEGFALISPNDLVLPDPSPLEAIKVGIQKCSLFIGDVTSNDEYCLFANAYAKKLNKPSIFIGQKDAPSSIFVQQYIPFALFPNDDQVNSSFLGNIKQRIDEIAPSPKGEVGSFQNAERLYKEKEYTSAVISAYSELEYLFSKSHFPSCRFQSQSQMMDELMGEMNVQSEFREFRRCRNIAVHGGISVDQKMAGFCLDSAKKCAKAIIRFSLKEG